MKKVLFWYYVFITIVFVYIFVQFLSLKRCNIVYKIFADYILNKYCTIIYIILSLVIMKYDFYTGILLLILIIGPFKASLKEFFETSSTSTSPSTRPSISTIRNRDGIIVADIPKPSNTSLQNIQNLGIDDRFTTDDVVIKKILRQIKAQIEFDPYKTNLSKDVINEIYSKYFDNDIFVKLKNNNDDSKAYLASGNFNYVPTIAQTDYDLISYQNLSNNTQIGINPLADGINNNTSNNR